MDKHYLNKLFNPESVAVIGASDRANSVGRLVFENILDGKFRGQLFPVNLNHSLIQGRVAYPSIDAISQNIDLAIITTPAQTVPEIVEQCGKKGIKGVLIISAGFSENGVDGLKLERKVLKVAQKIQYSPDRSQLLGNNSPLNEF